MKKVFKYGFVYFFSLFILIFFSSINSYDSIWNYGFSYALSKFQIPFVEINMITPGFYNFVMAFGLLFCHNNLVYLLEQALLIALTFYFLEKIFRKNAWLFLFFMCFPCFIAFTITYNYFLLFLMIFLVYLEENHKSDYLIGVVLAVSILTKHSVGLFFLLPSIFIYFHDGKKLLRRLLGMLFPCVIYFVYLVCMGSLFSFIDLCILGMFDFATQNVEIVIIYFVLSLFLFIISFIYIIFNKKDILGYYVLAFFSIMIPIFSYYHFFVYLVAVSCLLMRKLKISGNYIRNLSILLCGIIVFFNVMMMEGKYQFLKIHNFDFLYLPVYSKDNLLTLDKLYNKYRKKGNTEILSSKSVWIKIKNEQDLNYFSVFLSGNFGYNGTQKMIQRVRTMGDSYYIVDNFEYKRALSKKEQFEVQTTEYIIKNSKVVENIGDYIVYRYEVME